MGGESPLVGGVHPPRLLMDTRLDKQQQCNNCVEDPSPHRQVQQVSASLAIVEEDVAGMGPALIDGLIRNTSNYIAVTGAI